MKVPESLAELDAAFWMRSLGSLPEFADADWSGTPERIGVGYGLDGTVARIPCPGGAVDSVVVKLGEREDPGREIRFYREFGANFPVRLARFWHGDYDDAQRRFVLVLEDLVGAEQGDCTTGVTRREQAESVVDGIARMHARYFRADHAFVADLPAWSLNLDKAREWWGGAYEKCVARSRDDWAIEWTSTPAATWERFSDRFALACDISNAADLTLCHTDLHLDNIMFFGDEPVVLDWPDVRRAPATHDLARFFVEGVSAAQRREWGEELLARYAAAWEDESGRPPPADWRRKLSAHIVWCVMFSIAWASRGWEPDTPARIEIIVLNLVRNAGALVDDGWAEL